MTRYYRLHRAYQGPSAWEGMWEIIDYIPRDLFYVIQNIDTQSIHHIDIIMFKDLFEEIPEWEDSPLWRTLNENQ